MEPQEISIKDFSNVELNGFSIRLCFEVYKTDIDGRKEKTVAFFKNANFAEAFTKRQVDSCYYEVQEVYLLTNEYIGFILNEDMVTVEDDDKALSELREAALAKLTPTERKALGLEK
ncbi:MAG: hypothetical protein WCK48_03400 [bacterium]